MDRYSFDVELSHLLLHAGLSRRRHNIRLYPQPWSVLSLGVVDRWVCDHVVAVPVLAVAQALGQAAGLVIIERFGKAVRTPARGTMLAQASTTTGRGRAFAIHEALDQSGALTALASGWLYTVSACERW